MKTVALSTFVTMHLNTMFYLLFHFFGIEKHVKSLAIVHCFDENTNVEISKLLSNHGFSIFLIPINDSNITQATMAIQKHSFGLNSLGIFLDYDCNSSEEFITFVSIASVITENKLYYSFPHFYLLQCKDCFQTRFKWLITDKNETSDGRTIFNQLNTTNLYVDAEIMCIMKESSNYRY